MRPLSLRLRNFLSHADSTLRLANRGLVLIDGENRDMGGSNGSGKSAIFEGIRWAIDGSTSRGIRGADVCRRGYGDTEVTLEFESRGVLARITRYQNHKQFGNQLKFEIAGKDATQSTGKETQAKIYEFLQLDITTFTNVVLFPQGTHGFTSLTDSEQKAVFEKLLNLERFGEAQLRTKAAVAELEANRLTTVGKLGTCKALAAAAADAYSRLRNEKAKYEQQKQEKIQRLQERWFLHDAQKPSPPPVAEAIQQLQARLGGGMEQSLRDVLQQCNHHLNLSVQEVTKLRSSVDVLTREKGKIRLGDPEAEAKKHDTCPSCGQDMPAEAKDRLRLSLCTKHNEEKKRLQSLQEEIAAAELALGPALDKQTQLLGGKAQVENELQTFNDARAQLAQLQAQVSRFDRDLDSWVATGKGLEEQIASARAETANFDPLIEAEQKKHSDQVLIEQKLNEEITWLDEELAYHKFWVEGFGNKGLKSLLIDTATPYLNEVVAKYVHELTNGQCGINFTTLVRLANGELRDKFSVEVSYTNGGETYKSVSGGEARRVDVAVGLALGDLAASRASSSVRLRLLDEPFEALDTIGCEAVVHVLRTHVLPTTETILVMSHNEDLKSLFEQRITVIKENGVSRIHDAA